MKSFAVKTLVVVLSFGLFGTALAAKDAPKDAPSVKIFRVNR